MNPASWPVTLNKPCPVCDAFPAQEIVMPDGEYGHSGKPWKIHVNFHVYAAQFLGAAAPCRHAVSQHIHTSRNPHERYNWFIPRMVELPAYDDGLSTVCLDCLLEQVKELEPVK